MVVDTCDLIPDEICDISAVFLAVHTDNGIGCLHPGMKMLIRNHMNAKGFQHLGSAELIDTPGVSERALDSHMHKKTLKSKSRGDGVRIREIVGLDVYMLSLTELDQPVKIFHKSVTSFLTIHVIFDIGIGRRQL